MSPLSPIEAKHRKSAQAGRLQHARDLSRPDLGLLQRRSLLAHVRILPGMSDMQG
jgi:hypothetical protein